MARKRLIRAARDLFLSRLETKPALDPALLPAAPIAQVAGDGAAVSRPRARCRTNCRRARAEGRLVPGLPLGAIEADHLVRDRDRRRPGRDCTR